MEILICIGEHDNLLHFQEIIYGSHKLIVSGSANIEKSIETVGL